MDDLIATADTARTYPDSRSGGRQWRKDIATLYAYLRRDMSDAKREHMRLYPRTGSKAVIRTVPLIWRMARELATLYRQSPSRSWQWGADRPDLDTMIAGIYRGAEVDVAMRCAQEQLVALNNSIILVWPSEATQGVRLLNIPAHLVRVERRDFLSHHEKDLTAVHITMTVGSSGLTGHPVTAVATITPTEAYWSDGPQDLVGTGLWSTTDTSNPLGEIPIIMMRGSKPASDEWYAPAPQDLLDAQRAMCHGFTDAGTFTRLQGFSQPYMEGLEAKDAKTIQLGPERIVGMPMGSKFGFASPSPDLAGVLAIDTAYSRTVIAMSGLSPDSILKSSGGVTSATGLAIIERDRQAERSRHIIEFARGEQRLYSLLRKWVNHLRGELLPKAMVKVKYHSVRLPADPLHEAQAQKMRIGLGQTSEARERARAEGVSLADAQALVLEDVRLSMELARVRASAEPLASMDA